MGFHEVSDYFFWPSFHAGTVCGDIIINMDLWNELPADLKAIVSTAAIYLGDLYNWRPSASEAVHMQKMLDYGLEQTQLSEADYERATILGWEVAKEWRTKTQFANDLINSVFDYKTAMRQVPEGVTLD